MLFKCWPTINDDGSKLDVSVYHANTQEGFPSHFSNKSYTLITILADNQFAHVIIK